MKGKRRDGETGIDGSRCFFSSAAAADDDSLSSNQITSKPLTCTGIFLAIFWVRFSDDLLTAIG